jgi:hypothetical protein
LADQAGKEANNYGQQCFVHQRQENDAFRTGQRVQAVISMPRQIAINALAQMVEQ